MLKRSLRRNTISILYTNKDILKMAESAMVNNVTSTKTHFAQGRNRKPMDA